MLRQNLLAIVSLLPLYVQAGNRQINEWTAMGDSYASGVGAGPQPADDTNRCFRFPNAYPAIMQTGPGSIQPNPQKWNNVACSGNTASQILEKEFLDAPEPDGPYGDRPAWGDSPEFVTLTMGGNDIGILNLVLTCILSFKLWGMDCEEVIQNGMDIAQSAALQNDFTAVIEKAYTKGRSTSVGSAFQIFVTGYAQFFNDQTTQCNGVTFEPSWNPLPAQYLTVERRTAMNTLALTLNSAIKSAVDAIDPQYNVHYVDYDSQFEGHRFCDQDEPNANNPNTWFFNWYTTDDPTLEAAFKNLTAYQSSLVGQSTGTFQTDEDFIHAIGDSLGDSVDEFSTLSDTVRIFHPTSLGHQAIRNVMESALEAAGVPEPLTAASSVSSSVASSVSSTVASSVTSSNASSITSSVASSVSSSVSASTTASPPAYATGICTFHLIETQDCENSGDSLYGNVTMMDNNKAIIGQSDTGEDHPLGYAMDSSNPYSFVSKLPQSLVITGEVKNDYVQFAYGGPSWQSNMPSGGGACTVGGWDPRSGPSCNIRFGLDENAVKNMDCSFPC